MDIHKARCKKLKEIRKKVADTLNIDLHQTECTYEGRCSGTCPKCQQEERQLNRALLARTAMATGVVAMGVGLTGCDLDNAGALEGDTKPVEDLYEGITEIEENGTYGSTEENWEGAETWNPDEYEMTGEVVQVDEEDGIQVLEGDVTYIEEDNSQEGTEPSTCKQE